MSKHQKLQHAPEFEPVRRPIAFPHEVEAWIHSAEAATRGLMRILKVVAAPRARIRRRQRKRLMAAERFLLKSVKWIRISRHPIHPAKKEK